MWTILVFITNQLLYSFRMYINITTKRICSIVFQLKEFKCSTFLYINSNRPGRLSFRLPRILYWRCGRIREISSEMHREHLYWATAKCIVVLLRILSDRYNCTNIVKYIKNTIVLHTLDILQLKLPTVLKLHKNQHQ